MNISKLSVIVPAYNEENTIQVVLEKLKNVALINNIQKEIIVVNDASKDSTELKVKEYIGRNAGINIQYFRHDFNQGKGAALHTGIKKATGDFLIVQDADLEYDPAEFNILLQPVLDGHADVVFGSRFRTGKAHRVLFFWHSIGNHILTFLTNMFTNMNYTDMETCYKLFKSDIIKGIVLKEKRFGFEPEVTSKVSRIPGVRIYEVGISYYGRTFSEGKKISWKDGFRAIYCIIKYNIFSR